MTKTQVAELVAIRYQFGHYFCQLLEKLLVKVPEGSIKEALRQNLDEEMGRSTSYPGPAHKEGRKKLLEALGFNYEKWEPGGSIDQLDTRKLHPAAKKVLDVFIMLIDHRNYLVGAAAIAASESMVPQQYANLVFLLRKHWPELADEDMRHLLDHIKHDVHHGNDLEVLLAQEEDQEAIRYGKTHAERVWKEFWNSV